MIRNFITTDYQIKETIGEGGMSVVYRACLKSTGEDVAIKCLKKDRISRRIEDLIRFQAESRMVSQWEHPQIIKIFKVGEVNDVPYVVMELVNAPSLGQLLGIRPKLTLEQCIEIVKKVTDALAHVHQHHLIHRDISPSNILVGYQQGKPDLETVKLIDFGLAQIREYLQKPEHSEMVGTFSYMSPEMTGLLRRSVDERSDLYSLGIVFYQLLTGILPFQGSSVGSILHQQIAKSTVPVTFINPDIPSVLDKIVLKLLAKDPADRYQCARGLSSDLDRINGASIDFIPGLFDSTIKIDYKIRLIGREQELQLLKKSHWKIKEKHRIACFIRGEAGIGKTHLAEEFKNYLRLQEDPMLTGKSYKGTRKQPYGLFKDVLASYLETFNRYPSEKKSFLKNQLMQLVGDLGGIITSLFPQAVAILGKTHPLVSLEPELENQRFLTIASRFFIGLASIENGLVLCLDDLQWSDQSSLELLAEIMTDLKTEPLFIIGIYRDGEIGQDHILNRILQANYHLPYMFRDIHLEAFDKNRTCELICGLLHENSDTLLELSDFIARKSQGNPFFTIEVLKQLLAEEAIVFKQRWQINQSLLNHVEIHNSLVDTLLRKIQRLAPEEIEVLSYAAVIGRTFEISLLFELTKNNYSQDLIVAIVDKAIEFQLLERHIQEKGKLVFAHDRIKEAFSIHLDKQEKRKRHLDIARSLEAMLHRQPENALFDLAYHFLKGGDKPKTIEFCYQAGLKSARTFANEEALFYLENAQAAIEEIYWDRKPTLEEVNKEICNVLLAIGEYDRSIELLSKILLHKQDTLERSLLHKKIGEAYLRKGNWSMCEQHGNAGLSLLNEHNPSRRLTVVASIAMEFVRHLFHSQPPRDTQGKRSGNDMVNETINHFYHDLGWVYGLNDTLKFIRIMLRMLNLSGKLIPRSKEHAASLMGYGAFCMVIPLFKRSLKFHQKALALFRTICDKPGIGQSLLFFGIYYQWLGNFQKSIEYNRKSVEVFETIGDPKGQEVALGTIATDYLFLADYDKALQHNEPALSLARKLNDAFGICSCTETLAGIYKEKGQHAEAIACLKRCQDRSQKAGINLLHCTATISHGRTALEQGQIDLAMEQLEKARTLYESNHFFNQYTAHVYPCLAKAYILNYRTNQSILSTKQKRVYRSKIKKTCKKALAKTKRWNTHHAASLLAQAHYFSLIDQREKAEQWFRNSIEHSRRFSRRYEMAVTQCELGDFLMQHGRNDEARQCWKESYATFDQIGSEHYCKLLKPQLGIGREEQENPLQRFISGVKGEEILSSLIELNQLLASKISLDELLDKILQLSLQVSKSRKIILFVNGNASEIPEIRAVKGIDPELEESAFYSWHIVESVLQTGEPVITLEALSNEPINQTQSIIRQQADSIMCFPIYYKQQLKGVCYLDNAVSSQSFSADNMKILNALMTQAIISIENDRLSVTQKQHQLDESYFETQCDKYQISKREKEVLHLLINGLTNRDISETLSISVSTVKKHLYSIYGKTQFENREKLMEAFTVMV